MTVSDIINLVADELREMRPAVGDRLISHSRPSAEFLKWRGIVLRLGNTFNDKRIPGFNYARFLRRCGVSGG
jgi:hypothetical protein